MKKISYIFLIVIAACSTSKEISTERTNKLSKFVFRHYYEVSKEGQQSASVLQDSLIAQLQKETGADAASLEIFSQFSMAEMSKATPETEIHVELNQDTIWRYKTERGKIIGDFFRVGKEEGILYYHAKIDKSIMYRQVNLFEKGGAYSIKEYPTDRKKILGYDCYKIIIRREEVVEQDFPMRFGDTIYEMYVTKQMDLPAHALLNFTQNFSDFFPLEVRTWQENLVGNQEVYEIKEIEQNNSLQHQRH